MWNGKQRNGPTSECGKLMLRISCAGSLCLLVNVCMVVFVVVVKVVRWHGNLTLKPLPTYKLPQVQRVSNESGMSGRIYARLAQNAIIASSSPQGVGRVGDNAAGRSAVRSRKKHMRNCSIVFIKRTANATKSRSIGFRNSHFSHKVQLTRSETNSENIVRKEEWKAQRRRPLGDGMIGRI